MNDCHPLLPTIMKWANNAPPPLVTFAPNHEFQREIDLAVLRDHRLGHEHAKEQEWKTYRYAMALGLAIEGGAPCGLERHALIYHAASGSPLAFALCDAAGDALQLGPRFFSSFSTATRLPGFMSALEVWTKNFDYDQAFNAPDDFKFIHREIIEKDAPGADFWSKACQDGFGNCRQFFDAVAVEKRQSDDAKKKKKDRNSPRVPAKYRAMIEWGWLPLSLWARTAKDIAYLLDPDLTDQPKETKNVERDISEFHKNLKMPNSHQGRKYGAVIERTELSAKKNTARP
jgi:hypothetical protein